MHAAHVFWTAPHRARGSEDREFGMAPVERLVLAASALLWRLHSGPVTLFTDGAGRACVERWGIADAWSAIDCATLEAAPQDLDPAIFWDIGKTLVLAACAPPIAIVDLDLVVWRALEPQAAVQFLHWEELEAPWYPPIETLPTPPGYDFPAIDPAVRPGNTALIHVADDDFRARFVAESLRYARGNEATADRGLPAFLFSGQRLFTAIGALGPWRMAPFIPYLYRVHGASEWLASGTRIGNPLDPLAFLEGSPYMHLWGFKHAMRRDPAAAEKFARALLAHADSEAPSIAGHLRRIWAGLA